MVKALTSSQRTTAYPGESNPHRGQSNPYRGQSNSYHGQNNLYQGQMNRNSNDCPSGGDAVLSMQDSVESIENKIYRLAEKKGKMLKQRCQVIEDIKNELFRLRKKVYFKMYYNTKTKPYNKYYISKKEKQIMKKNKHNPITQKVVLPDKKEERIYPPFMEKQYSKAQSSRQENKPQNSNAYINMKKQQTPLSLSTKQLLDSSSLKQHSMKHSIQEEIEQKKKKKIMMMMHQNNQNHVNIAKHQSLNAQQQNKYTIQKLDTNLIHKSLNNDDFETNDSNNPIPHNNKHHSKIYSNNYTNNNSNNQNTLSTNKNKYYRQYNEQESLTNNNKSSSKQHNYTDIHNENNNVEYLNQSKSRSNQSLNGSFEINNPFETYNTQNNTQYKKTNDYIQKQNTNEMSKYLNLNNEKDNNNYNNENIQEDLAGKEIATSTQETTIIQSKQSPIKNFMFASPCEAEQNRIDQQSTFPSQETQPHSIQQSQNEESYVGSASVQKKIEQLEESLVQFISTNVRDLCSVLEEAVSLRGQLGLSKQDLAISERWYNQFLAKYGIEFVE